MNTGTTFDHRVIPKFMFFFTKLKLLNTNLKISSKQMFTKNYTKKKYFNFYFFFYIGPGKTFCFFYTFFFL